MTRVGTQARTSEADGLSILTSAACFSLAQLLFSLSLLSLCLFVFPSFKAIHSHTEARCHLGVQPT